MRGSIRSVLVAAFAVCAFAALVGQASAAKLEASSSGLLAVYGSPSVSTTQPIGGGLARNFGFGTTMLFQADSGLVGTSLSWSLATKPTETFDVQDTYLGATVVSNSTGKNTPLGLSVQFADLENSQIVGLGATPLYSDTSDRAWSGAICSLASTTCKTEALGPVPVGEVQINDVSLSMGVGSAFQGTLWGVWSNGTATTPPCITFTLPPTGAAANQTLVETEGANLGTTISGMSGKACLVGANNVYYTGKTPAVTIANE